ncbi:TPA: hypothetical protein DCZ39_04995 [Patescibacteria group bacterium]|nr:hypothetical protein [Candidatus Gracilibacteria bacterium]
MLYFEYLKNLDTHINLLQKRIKDTHNIFLVGGCVRDLLLGIDKKPTDIDFTMAGEPTAIYDAIDKKGISHFITEKFGTITLIQKAKAANSVEIKYELTPLRTESDYADFRHPGEITRSNDLLLDSNRRDFTINCMYYTNVPYKKEYTSLIDKKIIHKYTDDEIFLKRLDDHRHLYIKDLNIFIVQDHKHIEKLFVDGQFQAEHLATMLKSTTVFVAGKKSEANKQLRIIVDPHKGINDIINKRLKCVGEPDKRFMEDALRIIRAIRLVNVLNEKLKDSNIKTLKQTPLPSASPLIKGDNKKIKLFDFEKATWNSLKKNHALIKNIAKERIKDEIMKAFTFGNPFGFAALLDEAQLLEHLFPALYATKHIEQPIRYHPFDIYAHTMLTLFELQKISKDPLVRLGMLYHDVGKVDQFAAYGDNLTKEEIRAILAGPLNHRRSSSVYARTDFKALGFSSKEIDTIARYINNHHKPEELLATKDDAMEKKVRKFLSEAGYEKAMDILDITMADRLGQYNPLQNSADLSDINKLKIILKKLQKKE